MGNPIDIYLDEGMEVIENDGVIVARYITGVSLATISRGINAIARHCRENPLRKFAHVADVRELKSTPAAFPLVLPSLADLRQLGQLSDDVIVCGALKSHIMFISALLGASRFKPVYFQADEYDRAIEFASKSLSGDDPS